MVGRNLKLCKSPVESNSVSIQSLSGTTSLSLDSFEVPSTELVTSGVLKYFDYRSFNMFVKLGRSVTYNNLKYSSSVS